MITLATSTTQTGIRQRSLAKHCRLGRATELVFVLATGAVLVLGGQAQAQDTLQFNEGGGTTAGEGDDGDWDLTDTNWFLNAGNPNVAFSAGDDAVFNDADPVAPYTVTITEGGAIEVRNIEVNVAPDGATPGVTIAGAGANDLNITGNFDVTAGNSAEVTADITADLTFTGAGTLTATGAIGGGATHNGTGTGTLDIDGGTATGVANSSASADAVVNIRSTIGTTLTQDGAGTTNVLTGGVITGTTSITDGEVAVDGGTLTGAATVSTGGILDLDTGTLTIGVVIDGGELQFAGGNPGTIAFNTGELNLNGGDLELTGLDDLTVAANQVFDFDSGDVNSVVLDGGRFEYAGGTITTTFTFTSGELLVDGGTLAQNFTLDAGDTLNLDSGQVGDVTVADGILDMDGGTLAGALTVNSGTANVDGGAVTGLTTVNTGATMGLGGGRLRGNTLVDGGTLNVTGTGTVGNQPTDTLQVTNGGSVVIDTTGNIEAGLEVESAITLNGGTMTITVGDVAGVNIIADATGTDLSMNNGSSDIASLTMSAGQADLNFGTVGDTDISGGSIDINRTQIDGTLEISGTGAVVIDENDGAGNGNGQTEVTGVTTITGGSLTLTDGEVSDVDITGGAALTDEFTVATLGTVASIDVSSSADANAVVDGGTVSNASTVAVGTITMNSGSMAAVTTSSGGTFTQLGGAAGVVTNNGGTVNLTGSTAGATATGLAMGGSAGTTTLNGVTVNGGGTLQGGILNIDEDGNGATADAAQEVTGTLTISGTQVTLTDGQLADVAITNGIDTNDEFTLEAAGTVASLTISEADADAQLNAGVVTGQLLVENGVADNDGAQVGSVRVDQDDQGDPARYEQSAGSVTGNVNVVDGDADITGGSVGTLTVGGTGARVDLDGGTAGATTVGGGVLSLTDGRVVGTLGVTAGTVTINETTADAAVTEVTGLATISGGEVTLEDGQMAGVSVTGGAGGDTEFTMDNLVSNRIASLAVSGGDADVLLSGGTVTGGVGISAGDVTVTGATIVGASNVTGGVLDIDGGLVSTATGITINGGTVRYSAGTTGAFTLTSGTLTLDGVTALPGPILFGAGFTLDIDSGGVSGAITNTGGTLEVGGADNGDYTQSGAGAVSEITGGSVGNTDVSDGTLAVTGGTVDGTLLVTGGAVTIDESGTADAGDEVTGLTTIQGGLVTITDGDVAGVVLNETVGVDGADDLVLTDGSIASLTVQAGQGALNGGEVEGVTAVSGGTLTVGGATLTGSLDVSGTGQVNVTGGTITGDTDITGGQVDAAGGDFGTVTVNAASDAVADLILRTGAGVDTLNLDAGDVTMSGGTVSTAADIDGGTLTLSSGTIAAPLTIGGAGVAATVSSTGTGTVTGLTTVLAQGTLTTNGDAEFDEIRNQGGSVTLTAGDFGDLNASAGTTSITSGGVGAVTNTGTSALSVSGGTLASLENAATVAIDGGFAVTGAVTNQSGGTLDYSGLAAAATLTAGSVSNAGDIVTGANALTLAADTTLEAGTTINGGDDIDGSLLFGGALTNEADLDIIGATDLTAGDVTNTGTLEATATVTLGARTLDNDGTFTVGNGGALTSSGTIDTDGTLTVATGGTITAANAIDNDGTLALAGGTITGEVDNGDAFTMAGGSVDGIANAAAGTVTVTAGGTVTGALDNDGAVSVTGGVLTVGGAYANAGTTETGAGTSIATATLANASGGTLTNAGTVTGAVTNASGGTVTNSGTVGGAITNSGDLNIAGGASGAVTNASSGDADVDGGGAVTGNVTNAGDFNVNSGTLALTGTFTNQSGGTLVVGTGATVSRPGPGGAVAALPPALTALVDSDLSNAAGALAILTDDGGVTGTLTNAGNLDIIGGGVGFLVNTGDVDVTNGGTLDTGGTNSGDFDVTSGTLSVLSGSMQNAAAATMTVDAGAAISGAFSNLGTMNLNGDGGSITNTGLLNLAGRATSITNGARVEGIDGGGADSFTAQAGSTLDLTGDGTADTQLTFGSLSFEGTGVDASTVRLNVDLSGLTNPDGSTDTDNIAVTGSVAGDVSLEIVNVADVAVGGADIEIFTFGTGTRDINIVDVTFFQSDGVTEIDFADFVLTSGASGLLLTSSLGATGSLAASVGLTQTAVGTVVNRPTSPFVVDLAAGGEEPECAPGVWTRLTGGQADISGTFTNTGNGVTDDVNLELDYAGLQLGGDIACFGGRFNGFDVAVGGILGYNLGSSSNDNFALDTLTGERTGELLSVTETDFEQAYAGAYVTFARDRLFGDIQFRFENIDFTSNNTEVSEDAGIDLVDSEYSNEAQTLSGSVGYSWPIEAVEGLAFVSSVGFSYTANSTDEIDVGEDGVIELEDGDQSVGFVSATLARSQILPDEVSLLSYFGTVTFYSDFADARQGTLTAEEEDPDTGDISINTTNFELDNLGTYGELSAGINYLRLLSPGAAGNARQLNASARIDARVGESVESWGITGQVRIQF
ncbi:MAG: hypothetical protein AAFP13_15630 [Pseudomonadota bacterium]